jgi:hypothetical protein
VTAIPDTPKASIKSGNLSIVTKLASGAVSFSLTGSVADGPPQAGNIKNTPSHLKFIAIALPGLQASDCLD